MLLLTDFCLKYMVYFSKW